MYQIDLLEYAVKNLYRSGEGADSGLSAGQIEELLDCIDFPALLQAVRHNVQTVYAYSVQGAPSYRGSELFSQRATLLWENELGPGPLNRKLELWLLEDMRIAAVSCVTVTGKGFASEYREVKGNPWECGIFLDLDGLTDRLTELCNPVFAGKIPVYEL